MRKPQRVRVYEYMKEHNGITTMQAYGDLRITRLSARIFDLKNLGVKIDKEHIVKKKDGERIEYDRYFVAADNRIIPSY